MNQKNAGKRGVFWRHCFAVDKLSRDALQYRLAFIGVAKAAAPHAALAARKFEGIDAAPGANADAAVLHDGQKFLFRLRPADGAVYGAANLLLRVGIVQVPRGKPVCKHVGVLHIQLFLLPRLLVVFPVCNARIGGQGQVERVQMFALADGVERVEHESNQVHRWIVFISCLRVDRALHEIIPGHGRLAQAVQNDMAMQVSGVVVAVRVRDNQRLMPGKKAVGKLHANRLRLLRRQAVIRHVARVETDDVVMRLDFPEAAVLSPLPVQFNTFRRKTERVAVDSIHQDSVAGHEPSFIVQYGLARVAFMLKEQVLLHLSVVTVFYGYMLQDRGGKIPDEDNSYAFRVDGGGYSVLLRLTPNRGEHNVYAYCYSREALDRTLAEMQDARAQAYVPVYRHSAAYAREAGELEAWRASHKENVACREAIDKAIAKHFDGAHLDRQALSTVFDAYGAERVAWVLANSVITKEYDGRFSRGNRAWAQAENIPIDWTKPGYVHNDEFASRSHPAVLDGYIQMARREMETPAIEKSAMIAYPAENRQRWNLREGGARTGAEKTEQPGRPSMRSLLREKQAQTRADGAPQEQPSRTPKRESR